MLISIIIPARNEENNLRSTVENIVKKLEVPFEIIIVNDNSTDKTKEIAENLTKDKRIRVVNRTKNPGFGFAVKDGFKVAKGFAMVPVMADLCDDPNTINEMYEKIKDYDIVIGSRYMEGGKVIGAPFFKRFVSKNYSRLMNLFGIPIKDIANAFKMYRKEVINSIKIEKNDFSISVEIPLKAYFKGFKITEIPTTWMGRKGGKSKFKFLNVTKGYFSLFIFAIKQKIKQKIKMFLTS